MIPSILPPPPSLDALRAAARQRLDAAEAPVLPASFTAPCADCGQPRLSVVETTCPECAAAREVAQALDGPPALLTSWGSAERWRRAR